MSATGVLESGVGAKSVIIEASGFTDPDCDGYPDILSSNHSGDSRNNSMDFTIHWGSASGSSTADQPAVDGIRVPISERGKAKLMIR